MIKHETEQLELKLNLCGKKGTMSPLASNLLSALESLSAGYQPHPCGGFTSDDMEWRMGTAFTSEEALEEAIEQLTDGKLIRYTGYDDEDGIGHCYELNR